MRDDALGFFWEDLQVKAGRSTYARPIPAIPETGWLAPKEFPRLTGEKLLGLDIETRDVALRDKGPGWRRSGDEKAEIVGIAVATTSGQSWYFPMRHTIAPEQNLDPQAVLAWARDNLCIEGQAKVGANLGYDVDGLWSEGVPVTGPFYDVQYAEALIDENRRSYALDRLGVSYFGTGKVSADLQQWVDRAYGSGADYRQDLWRSPPCLVGPYAEGDAGQPLQLLEVQRKELESQGLTDLYELETELLPQLVRMRRRGVRVDVEYAKRLDDELTFGMLQLDEKLKPLAGRDINVNAPSDLVFLFDRLHVAYPRTAQGRPSFAKGWLEFCPEPAAQLVIERRKLEKYRNTFVRGYVLGLTVNDRLHALFHPLKGDENGTVSGRFSSSLPNLQNIPARDPVWGPKLRALFIPEDGELWLRHDWSQIEYRFLAHYARGPSGNVVRQKYTEDPTTDFHEMTLDMVAPVAGWDISTADSRKQQRKPIKNINFGLTYGMGVETLAANLGLPVDDAGELFEQYHTAVPFVKATNDAVMARARDVGYIKTVLGRRARFPLWEPVFNDPEKRRPALPYEAALSAYGSRIRRAFTHKALNRLLQGSAADLMKTAMRAAYRAGVQDVLGEMLLTCHDETGHSQPQTPAGAEAAKELCHILNTCLKLRVPVMTDQSIGKNWGECK